MEVEPQLLDKYECLFLDQQTRYYLIEGGRGSAKSWHVAYFLLWLTYEPGHVILFTRYTLTSAYISIIPEFIEKIDMLNANKDFDIKRDEIINKASGSRILFRGIKTSSGNQTASLKSIQGVTTWILDEAEELTEEDDFDKIDLSIRHKSLPNRVIIVLNPSHKGHFIYKRFIERKHPDCTHVHTTYLDNKDNLSQSFIDQAERTREQNPNRYRHIFMGEWIDEAEGLLWTRKLIDQFRIKSAPQKFERIAIAIDPAVTADEKSDETGIIVVGKLDGRFYILEDLSGRYTPYQWTSIACNAYDRWNADIIVAEVNNGGDLVEAQIRQQGAARRFKAVRATKGKYIRAEPIYSLYEEGRVYHIGEMPHLEAQLVTFNPEQMKQSPDRADAMVWGLTELSHKGGREFAVA